MGLGRARSPVPGVRPEGPPLTRESGSLHPGGRHRGPTRLVDRKVHLLNKELLKVREGVLEKVLKLMVG